MMNSDDIGEKGETVFKGWCVDACLIANKSTHDRAGWDYVVDFRHEPSSLSLDRRPGPRSCVIQVKAVLKGTEYIKLRLDMAERLAKDVKPCFIVTPVIEGLDTTGLRIWHIRGEHLARILKRLREEQIAGNAADLSERYVRFPVRTGNDIECTGAALRALFEASCTEGMPAYAAAKTREVATLGMDEKSLGMRFRLDDIGPVRVLDFFSGRATDVPANILELTETRFGLAMPLPGAASGKGTMSVEPGPVGQAIIRVTAPRLLNPMVERADVISVPFEVQGHRRSIVRSRHLAICITSYPDGMSRVSFETPTTNADQSLHDWANLAVAQGLACLVDGTVEVEWAEGAPAPAVFALDSAEDQSDDARAMAELIAATARIETLAGHAGEDPARAVSAAALDAAIPAARALVHVEASTLMSFDAEGPEEALEDQVAVVVGIVPIAGRLIAWHGVMRAFALALKPVLRLGLDGFRFKGARRLDDEAGLVAYAEEVARASSATGSFRVGWRDGLVGELLAVYDNV